MSAIREGRLFLVETGLVAEPLDLNARPAAPRRKPPKRVGHFWLCDRCASSWTLDQDANAGIALFPLNTRVSRKWRDRRELQRGYPGTIRFCSSVCATESLFRKTRIISAQWQECESLRRAGRVRVLPCATQRAGAPAALECSRFGRIQKPATLDPRRQPVRSAQSPPR
jgi:hypothetical protein